MTEKEMPQNNTTTEQENEQTNVAFGIVTQYIKDQSFENPNPIEAFLETQETQPTQ